MATGGVRAAAAGAAAAAPTASPRATLPLGALPPPPGGEGSVWYARVHAAETPEALLGVLRELGAALSGGGGARVDITPDAFRAVCAERRGVHPESWTRDVALAFGRVFTALKDGGGGGGAGGGGGGGGIGALPAAAVAAAAAGGALPSQPPRLPSADAATGGGGGGGASPVAGDGSGGARTVSDYRAPLQRLNPRVVPLGGLRVRRHAHADSEHVGTLLHGVDIMVAYTRGEWVKLASAMQAMISGSHGGRPYSAGSEGWVLARLDDADSVIPAPPAAAIVEPTWFRMSSMTPSLRVRRTPSTSADCVGVIGRDRMWLVARVAGAWGQLAGEMHDAVQRTPRARPYAGGAGGEGWVMLSGEYTFMVPAAPGSFFVAFEGGLRIRRAPSVGAEHVGTLPHRAVVLVDRIEAGWAKLILSSVPAAPAGLDAESEGWVLVAEGATCLISAT